MLHNNKFILNGILAFSIFSLVIAYYVQYILGHKPCNLCLVERIPYISAVILISLMFIIKKFEKVIRLKKRENCAPPAPPEGLFLTKVFY